ncbi:MAG: hypothetical protein F6J90_35135 [Moorea sp. SIOASIH]|uniref:hypothetical protein n=1 Tax=Moorena sp. SIOASIH TaxID=2607817 RepID=UPI0013BC8A37|nr:hypothetical protein [Moorena sp. SIOASIH]NEO41281.1 hypothetical protein [Moorena sp. SIOASIH]
MVVSVITSFQVQFDPVGGTGILVWNWHLASFLPGFGHLVVERASGVELASCQFPAWFRASCCGTGILVELASCQFPAWFRASCCGTGILVELASCQFPAWFRASW